MHTFHDGMRSLHNDNGDVDNGVSVCGYVSATTTLMAAKATAAAAVATNH